MEKRFRLLLITCIFVLFLFVLAMYAVRQDVDQDAARFGLMARHILAGKHFPVFYYGRSYTGSPKAYLMVALFALLGPTNFAVILSTAILSAGFMIITFRFVGEAYGRRVALLTLAYLALPPPVLGCWYTKGVSPYVDLLVTGAGMMLLGYRLIFTEVRGRGRCLNNVLLGLLAGIGWWLSPMILYYAVPLGVFWLLRRRKRFCSEDLPVVLPAFLLGSFPFWVHNLYHNFITFGMAQPFDWSQAGESFRRMFSYRLPELLGISSWECGHSWGLWLRCALGIAYVLLIVYVLWVSRSGLKTLIKRKSAACGVTWMLLLFIGFAIWSYVTTGYQASKTERLVLPLYSAIPVLFALCVSRLIDRRKWAGWALCFLILGVHAAGNIAFWQKRPVRSFRKEHRELISFLSRKNLLYVTSDFFLAPGLSFESGETIIASDGFGSCTIPGYLNRVLSADNYACILPGGSRRLESRLRNIGASWKKEMVGRYRVYHSFSRDAEYEEIIPQAWSATGSGRDDASLAFDRILSTRWTTRCPQEAGQYFELDLGRVRRVGKVEFLSHSMSDYPRGLRICVSNDGNEWEEALRADSCFPPMSWCGPKPVWGSSELGTEFAFPARETRFIRIELTNESKSGWWWSISEIFVYSPVPSSSCNYKAFESGGVMAVLEKESVQDVFTDFWTASRLVSEGFSPGRISTIANPFDYHNSLRTESFPPDRTVPMCSGTGLLLWDSEVEEVVNLLDEQAICYQRRKMGELELIKILRQPPIAGYSSILHSGWDAKASPSGNDPRFAFDGSIETRWTSERTQFPGMIFEVDMGKVVKACAVELNAGKERKDQPVALELWISVDRRNWKRVTLWSNAYEFVWTGKHLLLSSERFPVMLYTFPPESLRYIRLVQKGTDDLHYWSIREVNILSRETE